MKRRLSSSLAGNIPEPTRFADQNNPSSLFLDADISKLGSLAEQPEKDEHSENVPQPHYYSFWEHLKREVGWTRPTPKPDATGDDSDILQIIKVPMRLEQLLLFGFCCCLNSFLFMFTFFPLRVVGACLSAVSGLISPVAGNLFPFRFHRTQLYDIIRGVIVVLTIYVLLQVRVSRIYHYIRGQTFIKLYVIFNMLEIFDKLMCAVGKDVGDSLYAVTRLAPYSWMHVLARSAFAGLYTAMHALLYFTRIITLNAAINSTNNSLLTILISNNFVELKGSVFKRFGHENLFQICCADIVERFDTFIFLSLAWLHSADSDSSHQLIDAAFYITIGEVVVDWTKHSFVTKFNQIHHSVYGDFLETLAHEMVPREHVDEGRVDPTQVVARRVGLGVLPLACVASRFILTHVITPMALSTNGGAMWLRICICLAGFLCLIAFKFLLSTMLMFWSCKFVNKRMVRGHVLKASGNAHFGVNNGNFAGSKGFVVGEKKVGSPTAGTDLSKVDRYSLFKSRIPT